MAPDGRASLETLPLWKLMISEDDTLFAQLERRNTQKHAKMRWKHSKQH